jgi:hypothetical protein
MKEKKLTRKELIRLSYLLYRYHVEVEGEEDVYPFPPILQIVHMIDNQLK